MNCRGKRLTLGVMAVGFAVVLVLAIAYRSPILEHVEAWHFQLTRETEIAEPDPSQKEIPIGGTAFHMRGTGGKDRNRPQTSDCDSLPYIRLLAGYSDMRVIFSDDGPKPLFRTVTMRNVPSDVGVDKIKKALEREGWRVLEQRFPQRAYVLIRDERNGVEQAAPPEFPSPGILLPPRLLDEPKESDPTQELLREER